MDEEEEMDSGWLCFFFMLKKGSPGGSAAKLGSGGLELTFNTHTDTLTHTHTTKSPGGL